MKRIRTAVFSFCLLGLAFTACDRDKVDPAGTCNVQTLKDEHNELVAEYTYDAQKRLTRQNRYSNGTLNAYTVYEYAPAQVLEHTHSAAGTRVQTVTTELGADGLAKRSYTSAPSLTGTRFDTTLYSFDNRGYRTMEMRTSTYVQPDGSRQVLNSHYEYNFSPTGDLFLLSISNDSPGSGTMRYDFVYDYHGTANRNPNLRPYLGKQSVNHIKSLTYLINGDTQYETTYTYSLDEKGYIQRTDLTTTGNGADERAARVYAYVCN